MNRCVRVEQDEPMLRSACSFIYQTQQQAASFDVEGINKDDKLSKHHKEHKTRQMQTYQTALQFSGHN